MTRQTSIDAYNKIEKDGTIGRLQLMVLQIFAYHGPLTSQEMINCFKNVSDTNRGGYITRISELCRKGCLAHVGYKINPKTGMKNRVYDSTAKDPIKFEKPERHKCKHCNGKGYIEETQAKFNLKN